LLLFSLGMWWGILIGQIKRIADTVFPILYFVMFACAVVLSWFEYRNRKQVSQLKNQSDKAKN